MQINTFETRNVEYAMLGPQYLALLFIFMIGVVSALGLVLYAIDKIQTGDAIRRYYRT
jgi:hypothetical protein